MQNLLLLLAKYGNVILFVFLEIFCFYLIINFNRSQREIYLNSSNLFSGYILDKKQNTKAYLGLREINEQLHQENAKLLQKSFNQSQIKQGRDTIPVDTTKSYIVIPASVINNSINLRNNTITLNKGSRDGLKPGMGVINAEGVVGVIRNTSEKYAQVLSILNSQARVSVKIKKNNYHGNLVWPGGSPKIMSLEAIPKHADFEKGDTITTSGYSSIFPGNILIGTIEKFNVPTGSSNFEIDVQLNNDIAKINTVYVIENLDYEEIKQLENE